MPYAIIDTSTDGATVVAAPGAGLAIRVLGARVGSGAGGVTVTLKSGTRVVWKTLATQAAGGETVDQMNIDREIDCDTNTALTVGLSGAVAVAGGVDYRIINRGGS